MLPKPEARHDTPEARNSEIDIPKASTPPVSRSNILSMPLIHSTPQSKGIAEQAELHYDMTAKNVQNVENVKHDLKDTPTVDFVRMMKVFMYRERLGEIESGDFKGVTARYLEQKKTIDADYDRILGRAIDFCNFDLSMPRRLDDRNVNELLCQAMKQNMTKYCDAKTERQRYIPLVNLLNTILRLDDEDPRVIFIVNDPMIVESDDLPAKSKRKPDIIKVSLKTFKLWFQLSDDTTFDQCREKIAKGKLIISGKPYWMDVAQFWELKFGHVLKDVKCMLKKQVSKEFSTGATVPVEDSSTAVPDNAAVAESSSGKRKRLGDLEGTKPGKKPRTLPEAAGGQIMPPPGLVAAVDDDVQCGYYAIERFRASWQITHVSGIYLKDSSLNVLWYDPQGCIQSSSIDIVEQLALLVVLVKLQQQSDFWTGWPDTELPGYSMIHKCAPRFQLVGRMTSCADLIAETENHMTGSATGIPGVEEAEYYFKSSWPEDSRPKENFVIEEAQRRVRQYLPKQQQKFVLDHLPQVLLSKLVGKSCTAIVRDLLGLPTEGSRTQYLMVSKKLTGVRTIVDDYEMFKRVYLDIIRAHWLLWQLGIAHSDISFHNLMIKNGTGILNDFDLASIMDPGDASPSKMGHRRTGTAMFMSLDLLTADGVKGLVPRTYRHELESFAWVLLYAALCVTDGKENLNVLPFCDWVALSSINLGSQKSSFLMYAPENIKKWVKAPYQRPLLSTFAIWWEVLVAQKRASYQDQIASLPSDKDLLTRIFKVWEVQTAEWVDFKVLPGFPPNPNMPPLTGSTLEGVPEDLVEEPSMH